MKRTPVALTRSVLDRRPLPSYHEVDKDEHGKLLLIAGSRDTPGSAAMAATAALRSGCGKVTVATLEPVATHVAMSVPEAMVIGLPHGRDGGFARSALRPLADLAGDCDAVVAGPGLKQGKVCGAIVRQLLDAGLERLVLDAATLYALPPHDGAARAAAAPILLPHDREMAALLCCDPDEVNANPLRCGLECAARYDALTLVKGPDSHIVTPDGEAWRYRGGGAGLGVAGSGDTLAGILGGLLARGAEPLTALLWAVWLHGEAGAALAKKVGPVGFLAREISAEVPPLLPR